MKRHRTLVALAAIFGLAAIVLTGGCSALGYYAQSVHGQFSMLSAAKPINAVIDDPATSPALRARLDTIKRIRAYASRELALPDNKSYTAYADLHRPYVIWNVFATPPLSLRLKEWCFPILGCVGYRGYFAKDDAESEATQLRDQGFEAFVGGVPAYSTLGWFNDPILNTFAMQPEGEVARLIFHELAHQVVYVKGDTMFNESFATAIELEGVKRWLASRNDPAQTAAYEALSRRRADFLSMLYRAKDRLAANYASDAADADKLARKKQIFADLQTDFQTAKRERWGGYAGYDRWFAQDLTNAHLASVAAYTQLVPAFTAMIEAAGGDLKTVFEQIRMLGRQDKAERDRTLAKYCGECLKRGGRERASLQ